MPMWRRLAAGVADGADVEQLERNLVELGHDPSGMTIDETFDADTAQAVKSWQVALGVTETGAVEPGDAVFLPGPRRIGQLAVAVGSQLQPGQEVMQLTGTTPAVTIDLDARRQELTTAGDAVRIELPSGRIVRGTITSVGKVAVTETTAQGEPGLPTVSVVIRLDEPAKRDGLDGAPVVVSLERERAKGVLAVPVEALLALEGGGMALELVDSTGGSRLTAVETGTFADGYVEVEGRGVAEGATVAVPDRRAVRVRQVDAPPPPRDAGAPVGGDDPHRRASRLGALRPCARRAPRTCDRVRLPAVLPARRTLGARQRRRRAPLHGPPAPGATGES
jgi:peptidoglycan hydrolase-like protein with peptidoglycan-binding domain